MKLTLRTIVFFLVWSSSICFSPAAGKFNTKDYETNASFELVVTKSQYLKVGASAINSRSAFVSLVHGLIPGNSDGLEVVFLTKPITQATLPDALNNDAKELRKSDYAALVLFIDKENNVLQANLSYVVPGTTVARTVAGTRDELKRYFSNVTYKDRRLILKSNGSSSEYDSGQEAMRLSWNIDLNLPVVREVNR